MVFPFLDVSGIHNDPLDTLSPRELELLAELGSGRTNAELARNLGVSVNTVKFHRNLFDKLQVKPRPGRAALARKPVMIRSSPEPVILGIVGDSAAGKTTLTSASPRSWGPTGSPASAATTITATAARSGPGSVSPPSTPPPTISTSSSSITLRQGQPVLKPVYDHRDGSLAAPQHVVPRPYIIVEGLLGYHSRAMRECYDVKLFLEPAEELRVRWKTQRDTAKRATAARRSCARSRARARHPGLHPPAADLCRHRPHLLPPGRARRGERAAPERAPHPAPDPAAPGPEPAARPGANAGLHLELLRDNDGKPVDMPELHGDIAAPKAERLEELLWSLIPRRGTCAPMWALSTTATGRSATRWR